ncbi:hypothetical protein HYE68_003017 [Fusarium pseudograminearum]|nr:hypothetical protein HYE68_003017 [Fusarium pseudograminearum]
MPNTILPSEGNDTLYFVAFSSAKCSLAQPGQHLFGELAELEKEWHGAPLKHPSIDEAQAQLLNVKIHFNWMECNEGKAAEKMSPNDIVAQKANCWLGNATGITITILNHAITSTSGLAQQCLAEVSRLRLIAEFSSTHSTADIVDMLPALQSYPTTPRSLHRLQSFHSEGWSLFLRLFPNYTLSLSEPYCQ